MFNADLRRIMKEKKLTSRNLAANIGVSETYISCLLTGKKRPSLKIVDTLAKKYESVLLAMESMRPDLVAELASRIEAAASLFPRTDASENQIQGGASYLHKKKPG